MIALRRRPDAPLPGATAEDFFQHWLDHGTGGTCWTSSNALFELFHACGFAARRIVGAMRDLGIANHGSVIVALDGRQWLVDSSILTNRPLPLPAANWNNADPVWPTEVEPNAGTHVIWTHNPPHDEYLPCRLLDEPADHASHVGYYEGSRERSPFNQRLYARRNYPGKLVVLAGPMRFVRTRDGIVREQLSAEQLTAALRDDIGISAACVAEWMDSGALQDSFAAPSGPKPPPLTGRPPSQR
jgi:N-hydroxyarylamine O-acetyltransferase